MRQIHGARTHKHAQDRQFADDKRQHSSSRHHEFHILYTARIISLPEPSPFS